MLTIAQHNWQTCCVHAQSAVVRAKEDDKHGMPHMCLRCNVEVGHKPRPQLTEGHSMRCAR